MYRDLKKVENHCSRRLNFLSLFSAADSKEATTIIPALSNKSEEEIETKSTRQDKAIDEDVDDLVRHLTLVDVNKLCYIKLVDKWVEL